MLPRQVLTLKQLKVLEHEQQLKGAGLPPSDVEPSPLLDALRRYLDGLN